MAPKTAAAYPSSRDSVLATPHPFHVMVPAALMQVNTQENEIRFPAKARAIAFPHMVGLSCFE